MIQWYPGHMAKTKNEIISILKIIDLVIEVIDARVPYSSKNIMFDEILKNKKRLIVLSKTDLADKTQTEKWNKYYSKNHEIITLDLFSSKTKDFITKKINEIMRDKISIWKEKGIVRRKIKIAIVGLPNVGKSTLINRLANKKITEVKNIPGVTKNLSWIKINDDFDLLDTPGVLYPKFEDERVGVNLAINGIIKDSIIKDLNLSQKLLEFINIHYPSIQLCNANDLINTYRTGKLGKITLDNYEELVGN